MITVVIVTQFLAYFIIRYSLGIRQFMQFTFKIIMKLLFADTAKVHIYLTHRYIVKIVQVTEYTNFTKFRNTRQHSKLNITVHWLQHTIESLQRIPILFLQLISSNSLQHGLIILVNENHNTLSRFLRRQTNKGDQTVVYRLIFRTWAILRLIYQQLTVDKTNKIIYRIEFLCIQIQMNNGIFYPILLQLFHCQPLKKFFFPRKISLKRGY